MNKKTKKLKQELLKSILIRFILTVIILLISTFILFLILNKVAGLFIWYGDELLYKLVHGNELLILFLVCFIEFMIVFIYYLRKPLQYLEDIINATKNIYDSKDQLVQLPRELSEVEYQMNQIKLNVLKNQRVAKDAEKRKNDLVVYLAHDLKTPLTSVIGYLTLIRDERKISEELREKYLSISLEKAERLEDLINEFFEITRFNLSNLTLELSKVNLTRMLEQLTYEFKLMLLEKNLKCKLSVESNIMVKLDVNKIQRVFDNLLRNAINYSFENYIIEIDVSHDENKTTIKFLNNGITIPEEKLSRIFEQFYRLDNSRASTTGGSGLGLAISKEIIELHGGTISAYSEDEKIEFKVEIPVL